MTKGVPGLTLSGVDLRLKRRGPTQGLPSALGVTGVNAAASLRSAVTATANATPNTVGAWALVTAATTEEIHALTVILASSTQISNTNTSTLLNIGVGGAGVEVAIISNLEIGYRNAPVANGAWPFVELPIFIPIGTRISIQIQSVVVSHTASVLLIPHRYAAGIHAPPTLVTMSDTTLTTNSRGTTLATPGSINTKTTYTTIVTATPQAFDGLHFGFQSAGVSNQVAGDALVDIAIGATGQEVIVIPDLYIQISSNEYINATPPGAVRLNRRIPAGTQISARFQGTNTGHRLDMSVIGIPT